MVIEAKRNFFGLFTINAELEPGGTYPLQEAKNTFSRRTRIVEVYAANGDTIYVDETLNPNQESANDPTPIHRRIGIYSRDEINEAKLEGQRFLGIKDSIGWKPKKK